MNKYYYSIDNGVTWEGPFSQKELESFRSMGMIDSNTMLKEESVSSGVSVSVPPPAPGGQAHGGSPADEGYMVSKNGVTSGPYSLATIKTMLGSSTLLPQDMAWKAGMANWTPISTLLPPESSQVNLPSLKGFSVGKFFSSVFSHHTEDDLMDCFIAGTSKGTPPLASVSTHFPTPWVFARMVFFCLIVYFGFSYAMQRFENILLLPGMMFVGNFGIPFSIFVLFYELNVRRDVSFYSGCKSLVGGGLLAIILTLIFHSFFPTLQGAYWAGPIEEAAKLIVVILLAGKLRNGRILTGLLLGAAVGAGFSAFESAGYSFVALCKSVQFDELTELRAIMTPFTHVVWTAITAGAYWLVLDNKISNHLREKRDSNMDFSILVDKRFLFIALLPVGLHMLWNCSLLADYGVLKHLALGLAAWFVVLRLVRAGLNQIEREKSSL